MLVVPTSRIILLKNPIEIDYDHELTFTSKQAQFNYFYNLPKIECENATYQRKDNVIRFPTNEQTNIDYDDLIQYNYCMYQNDKWSNKWFYAFVKNVTFDNIGMSYVEIETDVWQSWCFDITFKNSFIEREHVNDDTFGSHTLPEGLDTGEFIINDCNEFTRMDLVNTYIGVSRPQNGLPGSGSTGAYGQTMNNLYSGLTYFMFQDNVEAGKFIKGYDRTGHGDNIVTVFVLPKALYDPESLDNLEIRYDGDSSSAIVETCQGKKVPDLTIPTEIIRKTIYRNTDLNGYVPKNNKCFTGEFNYLYVTNNGGTDVKYNYEDFTSDPHFKIDGVICVGGSIKLMPTNYKKFDCYNITNRYSWMEYNYGISCAKYPTCSWNNDAYTNWLVQNATNFLVEDIKFGYSQFNPLPNEENPSSVAQFSDRGSEILANSIGHYLDRMALKKSYSFVPTQAKGSINSGDITLSEGAIGFWYYKMSVKYEYAKKIDDFFSMFGYKVNSVKLPNITGRTNWNYVKTVGCNIIGDIPQGDLQKIKSMFNKGVTLWHNPSTFLDYSQSNTIVS